MSVHLVCFILKFCLDPLCVCVCIFYIDFKEDVYNIAREI